MTPAFEDHPRKRTVRELWNTPLLQWLFQKWGAKFAYFGLPGPEALDVRLWESMLSHVTAFEMQTATADPRAKIAELNRQLTLLGLNYRVYCGPMEEVIMRGQDRDGVLLEVVQFPSLLNLDFTSGITGKVLTKSGNRCCRFEAIRDMASLLRRASAKFRKGHFVLLVTVQDAFRHEPIEKVLDEDDLPDATKAFLLGAGDPQAFEGALCRNTERLKAFIFTHFRACFRGQNITSVFLPAIAYKGLTARSPMVHVTAVCKVGDQEEPKDREPQSAREFFRLRTLCASDAAIGECTHPVQGDRVETDPVAFLKGYRAFLAD